MMTFSDNPVGISQNNGDFIIVSEIGAGGSELSTSPTLRKEVNSLNWRINLGLLGQSVRKNISVMLNPKFHLINLLAGI